MYHFYPSAKDRREKINELQAMIFDEESASDAQKFLAPPKRKILEKKIDANICEENIANKKWGASKMKFRELSEMCVFPNFHADRSHDQGVNNHSKF